MEHSKVIAAWKCLFICFHFMVLQSEKCDISSNTEIEWWSFYYCLCWLPTLKRFQILRFHSVLFLDEEKIFLEILTAPSALQNWSLGVQGCYKSSQKIYLILIASTLKRKKKRQTKLNSSTLQFLFNLWFKAACQNILSIFRDI